MYDKRERLSREVAKEIRHRFPYKVFDIEIPRSVSLAEAPSFKKPIMFHAPQSPGAIAYERLAKEILGDVVREEREPEKPRYEYREEKKEAPPVKVEEPRKVLDSVPEFRLPENVATVYSEDEDDPAPLMVIVHDDEDL